MNYFKIFKRLVVLIIFLLLLFSCSNLPYLYHYNASNDFLRDRKIAIMPCNLLLTNEYSENQQITNATIEAIKWELQNNKFQIVEGIEINNAIDSLRKEFVNFYDPQTGKPDTSVINKYLKTTNEMIINKFGVTSVLYPYLLVVPAKVYNSAVRWHGRAHSIFPSQVTGQISALSLYVKIYDKHQNIIFDNAGGIQPLDEIVFIGTQKIDDSKIFKNPNDIREAVNIVFKPIKSEIEKGGDFHN